MLCEREKIPLIGLDGENEIINDLLVRMGIQKEFDRGDLLYSAGTMLWYRPEALKPLFDLDLRMEDFPAEPIGVGGTIAHAIERMISVVVNSVGFQAKLYNVDKGEIFSGVSTLTLPSVIGVRGAVRNYLYKKLNEKVAGLICRILRL